MLNFFWCQTDADDLDIIIAITFSGYYRSNAPRWNAS